MKNIALLLLAALLFSGCATAPPATPKTAPKKATAKKKIPPPAPPMPPGFTKATERLSVAEFAAAARIQPAAIIVPASTNWYYVPNVTASHDGFAVWTPANLNLDVFSATAIPPIDNYYYGFSYQVTGQYNGILVPSAGSGSFPSWFLRFVFTPIPQGLAARETTGRGTFQTWKGVPGKVWVEKRDAND